MSRTDNLQQTLLHDSQRPPRAAVSFRTSRRSVGTIDGVTIGSGVPGAQPHCREPHARGEHDFEQSRQYRTRSARSLARKLIVRADNAVRASVPEPVHGCHGQHVHIHDRRRTGTRGLLGAHRGCGTTYHGQRVDTCPPCGDRGVPPDGRVRESGCGDGL